MTGTLYIVATPIGNLEDMTFRAIRILKEVDKIACEDTRVTKKLLFRYEIQKPLLAYHQHSGSSSRDKIIGAIMQGENVAVVTDAGTPGVSDPGNELVAVAVEKGITVVPIPGVSALATLLSVSGIDMQQFVFLGFPPHKKGRKTFFARVAGSNVSVAYYDSPYRVVKNLLLLKENVVDANIIIGRELTKKFEEIVRGDISRVLAYFEEHPEKVKGEFTVIVHSVSQKES